MKIVLAIVTALLVVMVAFLYMNGVNRKPGIEPQNGPWFVPTSVTTETLLDGGTTLINIHGGSDQFRIMISPPRVNPTTGARAVEIKYLNSKDAPRWDRIIPNSQMEKETIQWVGPILNNPDSGLHDDASIAFLLRLLKNRADLR